MSKTHKPIIYGTGLIALDVLISDDPTKLIVESAGGTCGNVLTIMSFLGWDSVPISRMNGDPASVRVKADMARWGVNLDYAGVEPQTHTPIIVQQLYHTKHGRPRHRFDWTCPKCGERLPSFKAITRNAVESVGENIDSANVFFMDRLSRGTLSLAKLAADNGAVVFFEPSGFGDPKLFSEAMAISHVVKYANDRLDGLEQISTDTKPLVEIQTLGVAGLRVRDSLNGRLTKWRTYNSVNAPILKDACGAGDWCSAGIISKVLDSGIRGLKLAGRKKLDDAIKYGQILAAWNCAFEGARGGMYAVKTLKKLNRELSVFQSGTPVRRRRPVTPVLASEVVDCPACS